MKLFLKAIALAAKDPKFQGNARDELNRLIDVAEASGLVVWHDDFCFKSTFWDWGNRETGNINWGGYGSSYKPANDSYFKFQYPGDTATMNYGSTGKLTARKGGKPLDAVKALVLPEADADGAMQALLAKAGANPVFVADKGMKADAIVDLLAKKKCNFLLTADDLPKGLTEALDKASESKKYFFTLPVGRLRPLLEKAPKAPVKRGPKAPPAFADKDDAKAFSKLKVLLGSQKFEEIDQAITLLPGLPGVCDKLLEGISLTKGITAWTNDAKAWTANYNRPERWGNNQAKLPCDLTLLGETFRLAEIPRNDLFNTTDVKRYALFSVINAAPEDCAAAKSIREGLVALHWVEGKLPPLTNFKALRHLYLNNVNGHDAIGPIESLVFDQSGYQSDLSYDWILPLSSLRKLDVGVRNDEEKRDAFLKKASFPVLEEFVWPNLDKDSPEIPSRIRDVRVEYVNVEHSRLQELLRFPRFRAGQICIKTGDEDGNKIREAKDDTVNSIKIVPLKARGDVLPSKELAALKKLLRDDSPETVMQGLKILRTASPATIDALLEKSAVTWGYSEGKFGGNSGARLSGPFFDSLKRNDLGESVRINLLSLAAPGCKEADDIRKGMRELSLPSGNVPIDVSGFNGILKLKIRIDPSKPTQDWITGLKKLTTLQTLELELSGGGYGSKLEKPFPLGFVPPENVIEMSIDLNFSEVKVQPDFITVSPNLRKLSIEGLGPLSNISALSGLNPSKLEELVLKYSFSQEENGFEDLTALAPFVNLKMISGSRSNLKSLKGVSAFNDLRSLELESDGLEDISELAQVPTLERLELGDNPKTEKQLVIGQLCSLSKLVYLNCGGHSVADPESLLKFRPDTAITLKNLKVQNE